MCATAAACPAARAAAAAAALTSDAAPPAMNRRWISSATPRSPRPNARARAIASRGRPSPGTSASNTHSTRSAQSAAQTATARRSASLSVWGERTPLPIFGHELAGGEGRARGIGQHGQPHPRSVEWWNEYLSAEFDRLIGGRVGIVDGECDVPVRLLLLLQRFEHGNHVLEAGRAHLSDALPHARSDRLEVVAVAGQCPELRASEGQRGPAEHLAVEPFRCLHIACAERVEVDRAVLVDDPRALGAPGLPHTEPGALRVFEDRHPTGFDDVKCRCEHI